MDDSELLDRCVRRIEGAWEELLKRHRTAMERAGAATLARVLGSAPPDDVEAVVESVLVGLVKDNFAALRAFAGRSSLAGYLRAIATRAALNHVRSERRKGWLRFRPLDAAPDPPAPPPSEDPTLLARMAQMTKALEQLPSRDRLILKMFHLDGASYKEIAHVLDMPTGAVSPTLIRAREKLRVLIERER